MSKAEKIWTEHFHKYGHTGYGSKLVYVYDQYLRIRSVFKILENIGINFKAFRVLDVGCGVGDFILEFAKRGVLEIIGVDISKDAIEFAEKRLSNFNNVKLVAGKIENLNFKNYFDLVISVTVLQHITSEKAFFRAIDRIVNATRIGGKILILETSPLHKENVWKNPRRVIRTKEEWIYIFAQKSCQLIYEAGIPQIGTRILSLCDYILDTLNIKKKIYNLINLYKNEEIIQNRLLKVLFQIMVFLTMLFFPFPSNLTELNILVFEKKN